MDRFAYDNVGFWLARRADLGPHRVAVEHLGRSVTYAELDERANRCAGALRERGVVHGQRVAVLAANRVEYAELFFACARLGAVLVPLNTRLAEPELRYTIADSLPVLLAADDLNTPVAEELRTMVPEFLSIAPGAPGDGPGSSYEQALAAADPSPPDLEPPAPDDPVTFIYTSGTTGRPKGAMLTHANFFWTNLNILLALDFLHDERSLMVLPMFHVGGWNVNTLAVWMKGGTVVLEREFDVERCFDLIEHAGITSIMGVPTLYLMLTQSPRFPRADLSSLRQAVCGGSPAPEKLIRTWEDRGVKFVQGYGLTEAAPNVLCLPPEDSLRKAGYAGKPYFFVDVRLQGEDDELLVRSPSVMKGYWQQPEATAETLAGGWLHTGDVAAVDDEGYYRIVDRVKDMILTGGENVYPAEVENVLYEHPAVAAAAVIGVPDERWGESVRAVVVLTPEARSAPPSEADLVAFCRERLAGYKTPRSVVFADELPRNPIGKVLKHVLRRSQAGQERAGPADQTTPRDARSS